MGNVKHTRHSDMSKMVDRNMKVIEGIEELRADERQYVKRVEQLGERLIELKNTKKKFRACGVSRGCRRRNGRRRAKTRARRCRLCTQAPNPRQREASYYGCGEVPPSRLAALLRRRWTFLLFVFISFPMNYYFDL